MKYKKKCVQDICIDYSAGNQHDRSDSAVCLGGGWLEEKFKLPVTIPFIILGVLAGMRNVYLLVRHANEDLEEKKEEGKDEKR